MRPLVPVVLSLVWIVLPARAGEVDFNRDIRPILSGKCFQCHGPDEASRKGDLRLDFRNAAVREDGSSAIVPGAPEISELIARITADDPHDVMPPPKVKKPVTHREARLLEQWIKEGAAYDEHWSFQPIDRAASLPPVTNGRWPKNGIDHFILARLENEDIRPSDPASPATLARRLSIDLTGLLPDPERVARFVAHHETSPDEAVAAFADELLASPHYGERWGRHWLDQARYADSHGYTIDGERIMWPYRDWVIRALNRDLPFDRFTVEQLAGDLLENPTKHQLIASAFHRNTLINQEGGTDDEQFRNEEVVDRVNTTGAVWMGLTLGCAQCHTHKFDPITQREYYELFAFFNQGVDVNNTGATIRVAENEVFSDEAAPELVKAYKEAKAAVARLEREKGERRKTWEAKRLESFRRQDRSPGAKWESVTPATFSADGGAPLTLLDDRSLLAGKGAPRETYHVTLQPSPAPVAAVRLRLLTDPSLPKNGPGRAGNGNIVLTRVEFRSDGEFLTVASAQHDHAQPGFSAAFTIDGKPETGWAINVGKGTAPGVKMNAPHEVHYSFETPVPPGRSIELVLRHELNDHYNIGRFALDVSATPPLSIGDDRLKTILEKDVKERSREETKFLEDRFAGEDTVLRKARQTVRERAEAIGFGEEVSLMVMKDLPPASYRTTYLQVRGDFLRPDEKAGPLTPGVPAIFPGLKDAPESLGRNRLHLAKWLVDPAHPLTARVTVNRVWMRYFGKGIVATENDFGTQGSFPTHSALLDWLSLQFIEKGWSMKELHRLIVNSATYRQSSRARPELAEMDPLNHLLARQNRLRFDAEIVRDAALSASGLLHPVIGGPGVTPPQPDGVYAFTQSRKKWIVPEDRNRFRRALYVKFFRSAPYPLFTTFDAPDFQSVCTARSRSNTPLQALTLANDEALFELAKGLGERLLRDIPGSGSAATVERIRRAFTLCFSREPAEGEIAILKRFQEEQESGFAGDEPAAKAVAPEDFPPSFSTASAASWTSVARALMNTDEFISRE